MAKKITGYIKLQIPAGRANPAPPVGPALGQQGVNIPQFCKAFNAATANIENGLITPVVITVYADRSFSFITKTPPAAVLILKEARLLDLPVDRTHGPDPLKVVGPPRVLEPHGRLDLT